jgi:hypothetical protein
MFREMILDKCNEVICCLLGHIKGAFHLPFIAVYAGKIAVQVKDHGDPQFEITRVHSIEDTEDRPLFLFSVFHDYAEPGEQGLVFRGEGALFYGLKCLVTDKDLGGLFCGKKEQSFRTLF